MGAGPRSHVHARRDRTPWAGRGAYGDGKVFVLLLGHDGRSFETPEFQQIVLNGVAWAGAAE